MHQLRPSCLAAELLLDAGSALAKGGQVMFRPQPLHQLPKLPSHVLSEGASCLEPPPLKILSRRGSCLSLARLPFTVCSSLPRPGLSLVIYIGGRALMELWISAHTCLHIVWFLCGSTWFQQCPNAGICLFRWGQTHRNNVVPVWFHVVPTLMTRFLPQASFQIMWFLRGSTWLQQCGSAGTCLFGRYCALPG